MYPGVRNGLLRFMGDRKAGTMAIFALSALPLAISIGLSVDYARLSSERQAMQTALDLTIVAVAKAKTAGATDWQAQGARMMAANLPRTPAVSATFTAEGNTVLGTAARDAPLAMGGLFGRRSVPVSVKSGVSIGALPPDLCILSLSPSHPVAFTGPVQINANCGIQINGTFALSGAASINSSSTRVSGLFVSTGGATFNPPVQTKMPVISDPMATLPEPAPTGPCANVISVNNAPITLAPQRYCTFAIAGSPVITLQPGIHVFDSPLGIAGSPIIQGTDVMLYFRNGSPAALAGAARLDLSAATTGPYAGVLVFMARNDSGPIALSGDSELNLNGLIYAPTSTLALSGGTTANVVASEVAMIVKHIAMTGSERFDIARPNGRCGASSYIPPAMMALCRGGQAPIRMLR